MHYARALVRPASQRALQTLEQSLTSTQLRPVQLVDSVGAVAHVLVVNPALLLKEVESMPVADAIAKVHETIAQTETAMSGAPPTVATSTPTGESAMLYVRETAGSAAALLARRQNRLLAKLQGKLMAGDFDRVSAFVRTLLDAAASAQTPFTDRDIATYRGIVEELCTRDAEAALAVSINSKLPPLSAGCGSALAKLVDLSSASAVTAFLDAFRPRDATVPANETCATQLAVRLRRELTRVSVESASLYASSLERCVASEHSDPSTVFPTDAAAIQQWCAELLAPDLPPWQQAAAVVAEVDQRKLLPRRVAMDALSAWCLSDLERHWVRCTAFPTHEEEKKREAKRRLGIPAVAVAFQHQALSFILKDPRRNLVANRLLAEYAQLLQDGYLTPCDASFPAFLEECGECHGSEGSVECPSSLQFTTRAPPPGVTVWDALRELAPFCSFWTTLLTHAADPSTAREPSAPSVTVRTAPMGELAVSVTLPQVHECVRNAARLANLGKLPSLPVLFEDDDVVVVDKPVGLATSRHALSATQLARAAAATASEADSETGSSTVTDLVSTLLLMPQSQKGMPPPPVYRQGQVHRLDRETSGCIVFAKTDVAADSLRHQMGTGAAFEHDGKLYLALCLVLEPQLNRLPLRGQLQDPSDGKVRTHYRIVEFFRQSRVALVECRIQQGKKHQIRRHLANAGLPILGDVEHGGAACSSPLMCRVALHARCLAFVHPRSGEGVSVSAPLPADFHRALKLLRRRK